MAKPENNRACAKFEEDLVLYHYGELDQSARAVLEQHLNACTACPQLLDEMKILMPATVRVDEPPPGFWSDYSREMRQKIAAAAERSPWSSQLVSWTHPVPMAALAGGAVVLLALTFTVGKKYSSAPEPPDDEEVAVMLSSKQDLDLLKNLEILDAMDVLEVIGL